MTHSPDAEMSLIGCVLLDPVKCSQVLSDIRPEMFFLPAHQLIWSHLQKLQEKSDLVSLKDSLGKRLLEAGGIDYLIQVQEHVPSASNTQHYAQTVREFWVRREIARKARELAKACEGGEASAEELLAQSDLSSGLSCGKNFVVKLGDIPLLQRRSGITTGWKCLDLLNGIGYVSGQMTIVSGYHKAKKSMFMLDSARRIAMQGHSVCYVTLADLDREDIKSRIVKQLTTWGTLPDSPVCRKDVQDALETISVNWDFEIYDASQILSEAGTDAEHIAAWLRTRQSQPFPYEVVFIDYAQEMSTRDRRFSGIFEMQTRVASVMRVMAAQLRIPLVIASQITEGGKDGRDRTKGTRAWEEKAGMVIRVKQPEEGQTACIEVPFSRFGIDKETVNLMWNPKYCRFDEEAS